MTGFTLTTERREELADLLADDGAALRANHPQVAEYLATTSQFPPIANPDADAAFDLRLLHYMTGGQSDNPYWDIVEPAVSSSPSCDDGQVVNGGDPQGSARLRYAQDLLQAAYAYPITSPATLRWVVEATENRPVVEIGAGRGYWAHQLARQGVHIQAYDSVPPGDHSGNSWFPPIAGLPRQWHPVGGMRDLVHATRSIRATGLTSHVLFLCWPPAWHHPMAHNALVAYERLGGDRLIYIGEPQGGVCADDRFFNALSNRWQLISQSAQHVTWWNLKDVAQCWERVG